MKILIIHASAGAGHMKAAEAVYEGLKQHSSHQVVLLDGLDLASNSFKTLYRKTYSMLITYVPQVWGFVFGLLDLPFLQGLIRGFRRIYNRINLHQITKYLEEEQFDCIISTHFMPVEVVSAAKRRGTIKSKLICCVTDFNVHRIWLGDGVDHYCVASEWTREKIKTLGVAPKDTTVTGIPTLEKFSKQYDIKEIKTRMGLEIDRFTVLVATGSFGIGPIEEIVRQLDQVQVVVVSGHNKSLFEKLSACNFAHAKVLGLVDNMYELMAISDVMVTKPGGLSISEALVSQLPLVFFNAIPGQEEQNIRVLKSYGIGFGCRQVSEVVQEVERLRTSKDEFLSHVKRTRELARPQAVHDVIQLI